MDDQPDKERNLTDAMTFALSALLKKAITEMAEAMANQPEAYKSSNFAELPRLGLYADDEH